jgi:hypothetical protein
LCLDFGGVLVDHPVKRAPDPVVEGTLVPGALEFLRAAVGHFTVMVFSSRSHIEGGREAMEAWLFDRMVEAWGCTEARRVWDQIEFPATKPAAWVFIDDRAMTFTGRFPPIDAIKKFRPWNRRD